MTGAVHVDVSVVFGGNEEDIERCLESLLADVPETVDLRVTVVSNLGDRPLARRLEARFPQIHMVRNDTPLGFATNHNRVLRVTAAQYVLVANDDLVFLPGSLRDAVAFMERPENHGVGVLAPRLLNPDGTLQPSTYSFPTVWRALLSITGLRQRVPFSDSLNRVARFIGRGGGRSRFWAHDRLVDVQTFRGACMLIRGEVVRAVGPMDEASRVGVEEVEWHYRMRQAGWRITFNPDIEVVHLGSRTIRMNPALRNEYLKGFLNFFRKHRPPVVYYGFAAVGAFALLVRAALLRLTGRGPDAAVAREGVALCLRALRRARTGALSGAGPDGN